MQKSLSCGIIGAGSIGGLIDSPHSDNIASHAHAITKHPLCKLSAICLFSFAFHISYVPT